jgi:DNA polymerase (family X)
MTNNKAIASAFRRLAAIMELHQENAFKIRSYQNAYVLLRKWPDELASLSLEDLEAMQGVGKAIAAKIRELVETGELATYRRYADQTPPGVLEMLEIPGVGPKKVRALWKDLGIESVGELRYACNENRLISLNGFGPKTQADILERLTFYEQHRDQWLGSWAAAAAEEAMAWILDQYPGSRLSPTGALRRAAPVMDRIELLWATPDSSVPEEGERWSRVDPDSLLLQREGQPPILVHRTKPEDWGQRLWHTTATEAYREAFSPEDGAAGAFPEETDFQGTAGLPSHPPEWREDPALARIFEAYPAPPLQAEDIRGVIHAHSTWSDGVNSLEQMALACRARGYAYLVMTDHSRSAFYANGLTPERVLAQHAEIDRLNQDLAPFRIFKGIESDILSDGGLDYEEELLARFDLVIASIHSNLRMDQEKAMTRLLRAIEHPRTRILGHLTGRLLLSRSGYPVDHKRIIEACAVHGVAIELNANPQRLDIDPSWIPLAMERGVPLAVNPDAHSIAGLGDIAIGVRAARRGGLTASACLNTLELADFQTWLER